LKPKKTVSNLNVITLLIAVGLFGCTPTQFSSAPQASTPGSQSVNPPPPAVHPPGPQAKSTETFNQNQWAGKVDLLFVIDNSYSMQSLQAKVASRFGSLVNSLSDIDYHIGLTTTDLDSKNYDMDGRLQIWTGLGSTTLSPMASNSDGIFVSSIVRSETLSCTTLTYDCPSGNEQPLKATIRAIQQKDRLNSGFFRDGAPLAVIVLSNEDELSDGVTPTVAQDTLAPLNPTPVSAVMSAVSTNFGASKKFMFNGIIVQPGDQACLAAQRTVSVNNGAYFGQHVSDLAQMTGGSTYSICNSDYAQSLKDISARVRDLISTFELKHVPKHGTVEVEMTPASNVHYRIEGQKLIFDAPPAPGTVIQVHYLPD
jgi:hypothetical protein